MKRICLIAALLGFAWPATADTTVVFNEIMYHPQTNEPAMEWVELYNQMAVDMDISNWSIGGDTHFRFPEGTIIKGGGYLVAASDAAALKAATGITNVLGSFTNRLSNGGGTLWLKNNSGRVVDTVTYGVDGDWPVAPDGSGSSLAKRDPETASGPAENWTVSEQWGGTPGAMNFALAGRTPPTSLVALDSSWKADTTGTDLGAEWKQVSYNDSAWAAGAGLQTRAITNLFNTGVNANRTVLAAGQPDPHYIVTQAAQGSVNINATVSTAHSAWLANNSSSSWIGVVSDGTANVAAGTYAYKTGFSVDGFVLSTVKVNLLLAVDNDVSSLLLNGVATGVTLSGFAAFSGPYSLTSGVVAGTNTLEFITVNTAGSASPHAFRAELSGSGLAASTSAPLPSGRTTYYFRQPFVYYGDPASTTLKLNTVASDGAVFYLNGVEIHRQNLPGGPISYTTPASNIVANPAPSGFFAIPAGSLLTGANVLAVEVHLAAGNTGRPVLGLELQATTLPPPPITLAFNEFSSSTNTEYWLELANYGTNNIPIEGWVISLDGTTNLDYVFPAGATLAGGAYLALTNTTLGFHPLPGDKLYLFSPAKTRLLDSLVAKKNPRARYPDGTGSWLRPEPLTPGAANEFVFHQEIVINEIMYQHALLPSTNGLAPQESPEQWLELYNRSTNAVDLTGWQLDGGIRYSFPVGKVLAPGGYLVVAKDVTLMRSMYPAIDIVGDYNGNISRHSDLFILRDAAGNPANQLRYYDGVPWPDYANGGGSSLELRDPLADNSKAEAWAASDETRKTAWQTYSYRMTAAIPAGSGQPTQWNDFLLGLLSGGECLLDDLSVVDVTAGSTPVVANGNFENGQTGWRIIGTHTRSHVEVDPDNPANHVLHIIASGPQEHMHNHIETTLINNQPVLNGHEYQISYRARWLAGNNLLNTRLYFNRCARTTALPMPALNGTPGARNSRYESNLGPTYGQLQHRPVIPQPNEPVTVSVAAQDPQGVGNCEVWWSANGGSWLHAAMTNQGSGSYTGLIPGYPAGTIVQFYTRAVDGLGVPSTYPAAGPDSGALYAVADGQANLTLGHNLRLILTPANTALLHAFTNVQSNDRLPCTLIYDENRAYYNAGIRLRSSERGRYSDTRVSFHVQLPSDDPFRGVHPCMLMNRGGTGDSPVNKQEEVLAKHMLHRAGNIPGTYVDVCRVIAPKSVHTGAAMLMTRHKDEFIETAYPNGDQGTVFKFELIYYPTTTNAYGYKNPNPDNVIGTDISDLGNNKEIYRYNFIIKNHRDADDYSQLMTFAKAFSLSGAQLDQATRQVMDVDQWMRAWALLTLCSVGDTYTFGNNHNLLIYQRPSDKKMEPFLWDMGFIFNRGTTAALIGDQNLSKIINLPANQRVFYAHILDIINTTFNTSYMTYWVGHYNKFCPGQDYSGAIAYIQARGDYAKGVINTAGGNAAFSVSGPSSITTANNLITLTGTAPVQAAKIKVNGLEYPLTWNTIASWTMRVPAAAETNLLQIVGYDVNDQPLTNLSQAVQVFYTNAVPKPQGTLAFSEIMYNPMVAGAEYVELYNASQTYTFELTGWRVNGLGYTFPSGSYIPPRGFLVLAKNRDAYFAAYGASAPLFAAFDGNLQADGETLTLFRPKPGGAPGEEEVVDRVRYEPNAPWPAGANARGAALQLIDPRQDHSRVLNWSDGSGWQFVSFTMSNKVAMGANLQIRTKAAGELYLDDFRVETGFVAGGSTNLVVNGDFESPLAGTWLLGSNVLGTTLSTEFKHSGNASLRLVASARANTIPTGLSQLPLPLATGETYTVSFWFLPSATVTNVDVFAGYTITSNNIPVQDLAFIRSPGAVNPVALALPDLPALWLNEVQPENLTGPVDNFGDRDPWVEIFNNGTNAVSLDGWYLADNYTNLAQWPFPAGTVINPGEFKVIWADGQPAQGDGTNLHASFRLTPGSGTVALVMPLLGAPAVLDYLNYSNLQAGYSYGDDPDGQMCYRRSFYWNTPGGANNGAAAPIHVFINEWMADNASTLVDPVNHQFEDWIELYNPDTNYANLAGHTLGNGNNLFVIPEGYSIPPRGYFLVWADGLSASNNPAEPELHVNFKLNKRGESIGLFAPDHSVIDYVIFGQQTNDISEGRYPDGSPNITFMPTPTPRQPNAPGLVAPSSNAPPVFGPLPDRQLLLGQRLAFTVTATDGDLPAQTLTFALGPDAPAGAAITLAGQFSWTPARTGTNLITVMVGDSGWPPLSATNSFVVRVGAPPKFTPGQLQISGGQFRLQIEALDGLIYRLEYKNSLQDTGWLTLDATRNPTNGAFLFSDPATNQQRFYRALQAP